MSTTFEYPLVIDEATRVRVSMSDKENVPRASCQTTLALEGGNMKGKKRTLTLVDGGKLVFHVLDACKSILTRSFLLHRRVGFEWRVACYSSGIGPFLR